MRPTCELGGVAVSWLGGNSPFLALKRLVNGHKIRDRTSVSQGILLIPTVQSLNDPTRADHPVATTNRVVLGPSVVFVMVVTVVRQLTSQSFSGEKKKNLKRSTTKKRMGQETTTLDNHPS